MTETGHPAATSDAAVADRVAQRWLNLGNFPHDYTTDMVLESLLRIARSHRYVERAEDAWRIWRARGYKRGTIVPFEHEPFGNLGFELHRDHDRQMWVESYVAESRRCRSLTQRTEDGLVRHPPLDPQGFVLIDGAQAYAARMARTGFLTGQRGWYDEAVAQIVSHACVLIDSETQLWGHSRNRDGRVNHFHWSRAQGWALKGLVETLRYLPAAHSAHGQLVELLNYTLTGLERVMDTEGGWRLLVDRPETPLEASGTAMTVYALALSLRKGWFERHPIWMAMLSRSAQAMRNMVDSQGIIRNGCPGTGPRPSLERWRQITLADDEPHAVASVIDALTETAALFEHEEQTSC